MNPKLRTLVVPSPVEAPDMPNSPCRMIERDRRLRVCAFGTPAPQATATIAVVGDSHASHWRPALDAVAKRRGWRMLSLTRTGCPFTRATIAVPEPARSHCVEWNRQIAAWLLAHREVRTVLVAAHAGSTVVAPPRRDPATIRRAGYENAWRPLLRDGRRLVVIRDTPKMRSSTLACVEQARARGDVAADACAVPRSFALTGDPQAALARRMGLEVVDLTWLLCDERICPPVIGGALAFKDENHLTPVFAATMAPYLGRSLDRALRGRSAVGSR